MNIAIVAGISAFLVLLGVVVFLYLYLKPPKRRSENDPLLSPSASGQKAVAPAPKLSELTWNNAPNNNQGSGNQHNSVARGAVSDPSSSPGPAPSTPAVKPRANVPEVPYKKVLGALKKGVRVAAGNFGEVFQAQWEISGQRTTVAIKRIHLDVDDAKALEDFRQEIELLGNLHHPNILRILCASTVAPNLCFVCEFMARGSLFDVIRKSPGLLTWDRRMTILLQMCEGLAYLHAERVVHRDLKSMNILVAEDWSVRVADFGISRLQHTTFLTTQHIAGSPAWMAPEVLRGERSSEKVDVYAFGTILWELVTLAIPWKGSSYADLVRTVGMEGKKLPWPQGAPGCPPQLQALFARCCDHTPASRPAFPAIAATLREIISSDSNQKKTEALISQLVHEDPAKLVEKIV